MMFPRDVPCQRCGAKVDRGCRSPTTFIDKEHMVRWRMIGIKKPTQDQLEDAMLDGALRDFKFRA